MAEKEEVKAQKEDASKKEAEAEEDEVYIPKLTPEEQDLAYELKAQMMRNIEVQNDKVKAELTLHEKMEQMKILHQRNRKLSEECQLSRTNAIKLMKMYERKAKEADAKLTSMDHELKKSQALAKKYSDLYDAERRANMSQNAGEAKRPSSRTSSVPTPVPGADLAGSHPPFRVNDIIRKNEVLIIENNALRSEIQRLKKDNFDLHTKVKRAETDVINVSNHLVTSESSRAQLIKRLEKEKRQHDKLNKSLTAKAADWLRTKRALHELEQETKWGQAGRVDVSQGAAQKRTFQHPVTKNVFTPKKMLPVERWADTSKA